MCALIVTSAYEERRAPSTCPTVPPNNRLLRPSPRKLTQHQRAVPTCLKMAADYFFRSGSTAALSAISAV
jgi:hypothetical protein